MQRIPGAEKMKPIHSGIAQTKHEHSFGPTEYYNLQCAKINGANF